MYRGKKVLKEHAFFYFTASVLLNTVIQWFWKVSKRNTKGMLSSKKVNFLQKVWGISKLPQYLKENGFPTFLSTKFSIFQENQELIVPVLVDAIVMSHLRSWGAFRVVSFSTQVLSVVSKGMFWAIFQLFQETSCQTQYRASPSPPLLNIFIGPCGELMRRNRSCSYQRKNILSVIWL